MSLVDTANGISGQKILTNDYARSVTSKNLDKLYCLAQDNVDVEILLHNGNKYTGRILYGRDSEQWVVFESRQGIDYINATQIQAIHLITVNGGHATQFH